jgi:ferritin-like metal-binding protein YciE
MEDYEMPQQRPSAGRTRRNAPGNDGQSEHKLGSLHDLFVDELKDLYSAEQQISKALPKVVRAAESDKLKQALQHHLEETMDQVRRLELIFEHLGTSGKGKKCHGMQGVLEEGAEMIEEDAAPAVKDAGLISDAQRVEHYEIAGYGCVIAYANILGEQEAVKLLRQTLEEEKKANQTLTDISAQVNDQANSDDNSEDEQ